MNIQNCILWHDHADDSYNEIDPYLWPITYCDISQYSPGEGNLYLEPFFRDSLNGDYHLMSTACGDSADSPCIDTGKPTILDNLMDCDWGLGTVRSDIGAYGGTDSLVDAVNEERSQVPNDFALFQNYPNPFNAQSVIRYNLPASSDVLLEVFDVSGRKVETLKSGEQIAGKHEVIWNAAGLSSGIYFYRLKAGNFDKSNKMLLLK